jgi:hypothetical protein
VSRKDGPAPLTLDVTAVSAILSALAASLVTFLPRYTPFTPSGSGPQLMHLGGGEEAASHREPGCTSKFAAGHLAPESRLCAHGSHVLGFGPEQRAPPTTTKCLIPDMGRHTGLLELCFMNQTCMQMVHNTPSSDGANPCIW